MQNDPDQKQLNCIIIYDAIYVIIVSIMKHNALIDLHWCMVPNDLWTYQIYHMLWDKRGRKSHCYVLFFV